MIVVTGATGGLGAAVVERLLERVAPADVAASVRDVAKAEPLRARGVRVRRGDFAEPASLAGAFEGAARVLVVSSNSAGDGAVAQHRAAIEAAKAAGAARVLYTSHMGAGAASAFPPMRDHAATEAILRTAGVAFTSLRNGFYAESALMIAGRAFETGELAVPEDGPVSWTARADLAEAAAIALASNGVPGGVTPPLTALETLDFAAIAAIASELSGRAITRTVVSDADYRSALLARGTPEPFADMFVGLFVASRRGDFAAVDPTLGRLLGRPPRTMRDVLAETFAATR